MAVEGAGFLAGDEALRFPVLCALELFLDLCFESHGEHGGACEHGLAADVAAEVGAHFFGVGVALCGFAFEGGEADALESGGEIGRE